MSDRPQPEEFGLVRLDVETILAAAQSNIDAGRPAVPIDFSLLSSSSQSNGVARWAVDRLVGPTTPHEIINRNAPVVSADIEVGWLPDDLVVGDDHMAIMFDGLPGLATRCWKDEWNEAAQTYRPCNAEIDPDDNDDLGLCVPHRKLLTHGE